MRILLLALAPLALVACGSSTDEGPPLASPPDVLIVTGASTLGAGAYDPNPITISLASKQSIKWRNADGTAPIHTVTSNIGGQFDSGDMNDGSTFTFDFSALGPGTYQYHCSVHAGMTGSVIVNP